MLIIPTLFFVTGAVTGARMVGARRFGMFWLNVSILPGAAFICFLIANSYRSKGMPGGIVGFAAMLMLITCLAGMLIAAGVRWLNDRYPLKTAAQAAASRRQRISWDTAVLVTIAVLAIAVSGVK